MIIGISGKIGSGKDLVGQIIQFLTNTNGVTSWEAWNSLKCEKDNCSSFQIKKFAAKLKDCVCIILGCTREQLENHEFKDKELSEEWDKFGIEFTYLSGHVNPEIYGAFVTKEEAIEIEKYLQRPDSLKTSIKRITMTPRKLLQLLGTECGRDIIHPNIWCNSLFNEYIGDIEEWKDVNGYEDFYQISSFGNVRSLDRTIKYGDLSKGEYHTRKGRLLIPSNSNGYLTVSLSGKTFSVHSLVANSFLTKPSENLVINHKDGNKSNNFYKNLEWVTQKENIQNSIKSTNGNVGVNQKDAKLNDSLVIEIKQLLENGDISQASIAKMYGVSPTTISEIKTGKKWKHVGSNNINIDLLPIVPKVTPNWVITDCRFPNEADAIKAKGGINIRINRPIIIRKSYSEHKHINEIYDPNNEAHVALIKGELLQNPPHESETALDNYEFDYVIENDGTIEDLINKVRVILKDINLI